MILDPAKLTIFTTATWELPQTIFLQGYFLSCFFPFSVLLSPGFLLLRYFLFPSSLKSPQQKLPTSVKCGTEFQVSPSPSQGRNDSLWPQNEEETHNLRQATLLDPPGRVSKGGDCVYDERVILGHYLLLVIFKVPVLSQNVKFIPQLPVFLGTANAASLCSSS